MRDQIGKTNERDLNQDKLSCRKMTTQVGYIELAKPTSKDADPDGIYLKCGNC